MSGKPYLTLLVKEKISTVNHRQSPSDECENVTALRSAGIDDIVNTDATRVFLEDVMREVDLYSNDINLMQTRFVSPLGRLAPDFYKFYLTDTVQVDDERCAVLSFYPHNRSTFGFIGHIYVPVDNAAMPVRKVDMHVPKEINLNYVDNLYITQTYTEAPDGSRLKLTDNMTVELSVAGKGQLYASRNTVLSNHSFNQIADSVFSPVEQSSDELRRDSAYWHEVRPIVVGRGDIGAEPLMARRRKGPVY